MRMKTSTKYLITVGAALLCVPLAAFAPALALPFFALLGFLALHWSIFCLGPAFGAAAAGAYLAGFTYNSAAAAMMLALVSAAVFLLGRKTSPYRVLAVTLLVILTAGLYLAMTADSLRAGEPAGARVTEVWEKLVAEPFKAAAAAFPDGEELASAVDDFGAMIPDLLLWSCVLMAEAASIGIVMLLRLFRKIFKAEDRPMARFEEWRLPSTALIGLLISAAAVALPFILKHDGAKAFAYSVGFFWASLFGAQGFATMLFVFRVSKAPKALPILTTVICAVTFPWSMAFLSIMGIREQITKRRSALKRYIAQMKAKNEAFDRAEELAKYGYIRPARKEGDSPDKDNKDETDKED